jgi:hypothetical protein
VLENIVKLGPMRVEEFMTHFGPDVNFKKGAGTADIKMLRAVGLLLRGVVWKTTEEWVRECEHAVAAASLTAPAARDHEAASAHGAPLCYKAGSRGDASRGDRGPDGARHPARAGEGDPTVGAPASGLTDPFAPRQMMYRADETDKQTSYLGHLLSVADVTEAITEWDELQALEKNDVNREVFLRHPDRQLATAGMDQAQRDEWLDAEMDRPKNAWTTFAAESSKVTGGRRRIRDLLFNVRCSGFVPGILLTSLDCCRSARVSALTASSTSPRSSTRT